VSAINGFVPNAYRSESLDNEKMKNGVMNYPILWSNKIPSEVTTGWNDARNYKKP
jgi:hypothetical protein